VIDAYSVKPLDSATLSAAARETEGLIVVEGMAPLHRLGIQALPRSGPGSQLLDRLRISRRAIEQRVLQLTA
jgi:transketolase C-terminal domain/subunit